MCKTDFLFMEDGTSCHTAQATQNWLRQNEIKKLCFRLYFLENVLYSEMTTTLYTQLAGLKHGEMSIMMKWNISLGVFSPLISTILSLCGVF